MVASHDHRMNTVGAVRKPARLRFRLGTIALILVLVLITKVVAILLTIMYTYMYVYFYCSTLTRIDEPYPMLVLCGPPGSGKGYFCKLLVEEFPSFFGLG